jgi:hypothetical protein
MLDDLVTGIYGCFLIWNESAPEEDSDEGAEEIEAEMDAGWEHRQAVFVEAVRAVARAERPRIGL